MIHLPPSQAAKDKAALLSIAACMRLSGLSRRTIQTLLSKEIVASLELSSGRRLVQRADFEKYLNPARDAR